MAVQKHRSPTAATYTTSLLHGACYARSTGQDRNWTGKNKPLAPQPRLDPRGQRSATASALIHVAARDLIHTRRETPCLPDGKGIDHPYFKDAALRHTSTRMIDCWPTSLPLDHYLIRSHFELRQPRLS